MENENNDDNDGFNIIIICIAFLFIFMLIKNSENHPIEVNGNDNLFAEQLDRYNTLSADIDNVLELFDTNIYGDEINRYCVQRDSTFCELTTQPSFLVKEIVAHETLIKNFKYNPEKRDGRYNKSLSTSTNELFARKGELYEEIENVILSFGADTPFVKNWNYVERNEFSNSHNDNVKIFIATQLIIKYLRSSEINDNSTSKRDVFYDIEELITNSDDVLINGFRLLMIAEGMAREND